MKRHFSYRYARIISITLLCMGFYLYNLMPHNNQFQYTFVPSSGSVTTENPNTNPSDDTGDMPSGSGALSGTPIPSVTPLKTEAELNVRGTTIALGESNDSIIKKLGVPFRIDETEYDYDYYIYNNDYHRLLYVAIKDNQVVGYYTDSNDFDYMGICSGSSINTVGKALKQSFSMSEILSQAADTYTVQVFMDQLDTQKVTGIYVMSNYVKLDEYTDAVLRNVALMIYDLTNSTRMRNDAPILSWSSSAALAARKHTQDMALEGFFSHTNLKRESPGDRLRAEGIFFKSNSENIVAGYGTAITSIHKLFNSKTQRNNILSKKFRYIGVGFAYVPDSTYQTYITQNFYR